MTFSDRKHPDVRTERFLVRAAALGDCAAHEELTAYGMWLVRLHAGRLGRIGASREEAMATGIEGFLRALDRFDPRRNVRLATFAWSWISGAMKAELPSRALEPDGQEVPVELEFSELLPVPEWIEVIRCRFGFLDEHPEGMSRRAVAEHLGLSTWQVRDRETKALAHLREHLGRVSGRAPVGADPL